MGDGDDKVVGNERYEELRVVGKVNNERTEWGGVYSTEYLAKNRALEDTVGLRCRMLLSFHSCVACTGEGKSASSQQ